MKLEEFADSIMANLILKRYANQNNRWTASFEGAEIKDDKCSIILCNEYGDAETAAGAMANYIEIIRGKIIVFDDMPENKRREYGVPKNLEL